MDIELLINGSAPSPHLGVFEGEIWEGINQVTRMALLAVSDTEMKEAELEGYVGLSATLKVSEPLDGSLQVSRFDGVIYEFHQINSFLVEKDLFAYRLVIRPAVWQLNLGADTRAFPEMSRIEVIDEILSGAKGAAYDTQYFREGDFPKLWQILQNGISDWKFVCRLMREAGINYYFGAQKDGNTVETMHLLDNQGFFGQGVPGTIPWNPSAGMMAERRIESFETAARAMPSAVSSTASFGDGLTIKYSGSEPVEKGSGGVLKTFSVEGQTEAAAKRRAKALAQGFAAERLTYAGRGNHFLLRAGERNTIGGPFLSSEKKILITSVRHRFHRTVRAATTDSRDAAYENCFTAVRSDVDVRPVDDLITVDMGAALVRSPSVREGETQDRDDGAVTRLQERVEQLSAAVQLLSRAEGRFGIQLGEVVEDTVVTDGKEMTCRIQNERFPKSIKAKVCVAWLVPGGGVTCLPRAGMEVYFTLEMGDGGANEAVVVGYRPSGAVPGRDPADATKTHRLKRGGGGDTVVERDAFSPLNRERVGIRGEKSVCEVTILDKEGSVSVNATRDLYLIADEAVAIRSKDHLHLSDTVGEQYGQVDRYVDRDQTEWIKGDHVMTVSGDERVTIEQDQSIQVTKDLSREVGGSETRLVGQSRRVTIKKDDHREVEGDASINVKKGRTLVVGKESDEVVKGGKTVLVEKDLNTEIKGKELRVIKKAASLCSDDAITLEAKKKVQIKCGDAVVTIQKNGDITIKGKNFNHKASGDVMVKGSKVKLN